MKKIYQLLKFKTKIFAFSVLFLVLLYVVSGRILLSMLPDYREDIERQLSAALAYPVTIEKIESKWVGFDPVVSFSGISINGRDNAHVGLVSARVAVLRSLLALSLRFKSVQLVDSHAAIIQHDQNTVSVAGIKIVTGGESSSEDATDLESFVRFLDGAEVKLHDNHIVFTGRPRHGNQARTREWRFPSISMNYQGNEVYASGKVLQPDGDQPLLSFSLNGFGVLTDKPVIGTVYFEARSSEFFDEVIKIYEWQDLSIQDLDASSRIWLGFEGFSLKDIKGELQVSKMNWKVAEKSLPPLTNVAGGFHWFRAMGSSQLVLNGFGFDWAGQSCRSTNAVVNLDPENTLIYADAINVSCLSDIAAATGLLSSGLQDRLEISQPDGYLKNILFVQGEKQKEFYEDANEEAETSNLAEGGSINESSFTFEAELDDVSLSAYFGTPMGKGVTGYIKADEHGGGVFFQSENFELGFPTLFYKSWGMSFAEGNVNWITVGDDVEVYSDGIRLYMPDQSLVYGDFILRLNPDDREDTLSLTIAMQDIPFEKASSFVPAYAVGEDLHSWLETSLVSGSVTNGIYVGHGSIEEEDAENSFTSSIFLETADGKLSFDKEWPLLEELTATIHLQNGELEVVSDTATIQGTTLNNLVAVLPESEGEEESADQASFLTAKAQVNAEPSDLNYWLKESPISGQTKAVAEQLVIEGGIGVSIELDIPVSEAGEVGYEVVSQLQDNKIKHLQSELPFEKVNGELIVSSKRGILAEEVTTELLGKPAQLSISEDRSKEVVTNLLNTYEGGKKLYEESQVGYDILLSLNGALELDSLLNLYSLSPIPEMRGEFDFQANLKLPADSARFPVLSISSNSVGLERHWPEPFYKEAIESESFWLNMIIKPDQLHTHAGFQRPGMPEVESDALFMDSELVYSEVRIGGVETSESLGDGLRIVGELPFVEVESWVDFVNRFSSNVEADADAPLLKQVKIISQDVDAYGYRFSGVDATIEPNGNSWGVSLAGDTVSGKIELPTEEKPLTLALSKLVLPASEESEEISDENVADESSEFKAADLPEIIFSSDSLIYEGRSVGAWKTRIEPYESGAYFRDLEGNVAGTKFLGQLDWRSDGLSHTSILTLDAKGKDIDQVMRAFGIPETLNSDTLSSDLALVWPGTPNDFDLARLSGKMSLSLNNGIINTSDNKTGFLRVFGILNAETLMRRLKFDFTDLYKSGLAYDSLSLEATIDNGLLNLSKPIVIKGPSGEYTFSGQTDLEQKSLDMDMQVKLPITQNVPLAALMLGAPQVGGAVWLVDKLLGEPLSDITSATYEVTGVWEEPKLKLKSTSKK